MSPFAPTASAPSSLFAVAGLLLIQPAAAQLGATGKDDIGFTALQTRLGVAMPTGAGLSVSQIEAPETGGNYRPDSTVFTDKSFDFVSGASGASGHATTVGRYFYGAQSLVPEIGVAADGQLIRSFEVNDFLTNVMNVGAGGSLPDVELNAIQNHSWIGTYENDALDREAIRRMDYMIQRDDFVGVFGLNNGSGTSVPSLLAGAYNGITVGLSNGNHSRGGTVIEGALRTRPDLVVPTTATSWAAPTVSGAAALLIETATTTTALNNARASEVVKSLLMTGATRDEPEFTAGWANSSTQPLDAVYGAGELNIDRSHAILTAGEFAASGASLAGSTGWDAGTSAAAAGLYFFDLSDPEMDYDIAGSLVWNRLVTATDTPGPGTNYQFNFTLANFSLRLFEVEGFTLGSEVSASLSEADNVEMIALNSLASGRYAWQVSSNMTGVDYGFSWQTEGFTLVPEPTAALFFLLGSMTLLRRRRGTDAP